jgi:hypothetical protein
MEIPEIERELSRISNESVENFISIEESIHQVDKFLNSVSSFDILVTSLENQYQNQNSSEIVRTALTLYMLRNFKDKSESILIGMLPREKSVCFYMHVLRFLEAHENQFSQFRPEFFKSLEKLYGIVRDELSFFLELDYERYKEYKAHEHEIILLHEKHADYIGRDCVDDYITRNRDEYVNIYWSIRKVAPLTGVSVIGDFGLFFIDSEDDLVIQLKSLPENIASLSHLERLSIEGFDFSEFPFFDKIKTFTHLKALRLRRNTFQHVPDSVPFFDTLETLSYNNESNELPKWVVEFAFQEKIYQKYVDAGVHPDDAPVLSLLEVLWECAFRSYDDTRLDQPAPNYVLDEDGHVNELSNTGEELPLRLFPSQLCELTHLKVLCLAFMEITSIPDCVKRMKSITSIFLEGNPIQRVPNMNDLPESWVDALKRASPDLIKD